MDTNILEQQKSRVARTELSLPEIKVSNRMAGLSVLGLVADKSACGYYRVINPLHMLKMHGANVTYSSVQTLDMFMNHDIIVAPRQHSEDVYELLREMAWQGKQVVFEIDDDLDAVLPSSPAFSTYHQGSPELKSMNKIIRAAHGLTTTTPEIAKWYYRLNRNVCVLENYIDFSFRDWGADVGWDNIGQPIITPRPITKPADWEGQTVIAWQGGTTHQEDLLVLGPQLKPILEKRENVLFAMYSSYEMMMEFVQKFKLPTHKVVYVPARHFMEHPSGLHGIDIGLAPIQCCQFNLAKSSLKCLEGMAVGTAMIASNVGPYTRLSRRHPGAILTVGRGADSYRSWGEAINYLLDNPDKLQEMKENGRKLVMDEYALEKNFHLWPVAWNSIRENVMKGLCGPPDQVKPATFYKSYGQAGRNDPCPCGSGKKYKSCCVDAWG